ncbi:bacillithiol biosynthesis cysteine-adding enzyme BshC [Croceimicrobium hydrocarbonivorans]|uniref:Putative cysteine ligase BshC n=1 Tax=Croceimicrobium hydrocarbonivorans TaxID=2761580 RepID=A0A7H0VET8_9FLAO|nr:bacillithiol biosynthesis cysteine-adding enzyme BshC [Croceimicrobium hydrocarbonivorans]QNR24236.1 bacillithiol biosynthesis cysteine-adding enzyme BshC [Croceimicrobium hydrocarbonivorans]
MNESECIPYRQTGYFSELILDYLDHNPQLQNYISGFPEVQSFKERIESRQSFSAEKRQILADSLLQQYQETGIEPNPELLEQIESLKSEKTFTVTTGHQLNILTGPLYFIYKIVSTINLSKQLKEAYPEYNFVPIYWMASEDHDFEEISFINLFGGRLKWVNDFKGPVGHMPPFGMGKVIDELEEHLGPGKQAEEILSILRNGYHEHPNLSQATRWVVHELFKSEGLVILDADRPELKQQMLPHFKTDLFEDRIHRKVQEQSDALGQKYFAQVFPRPINLFYLKPGLRERIEYKDGEWLVLNTDIRFNESELKSELENHPERFSPNVVLRPLYQEVILPNLAYIGGGGELAYWFQLKSMFDDQAVPFPLLILRNSVLLCPEKWRNRLADLNLDPRELFQDLNDLKRNYIKERFPKDVELKDFDEQLEKMFEDLEAIAELTDRSMLGAVNAQRQKQLNGIENLRKKLIRAEKRRSSEQMEKLERAYLALFPKGGLQERHDNLTPYYASYGKGLIQRLLKDLDPLDFRFTIVRL